MRDIKIGAIRNVPIKLYLASDHLTPATGKTITCTLSKDCAAFAAATGTVTEISSGWYKVALSAADTGTLGELVIRCTAAACDDAERTVQIVAYDPQDAVALGLSAVVVPPTATENADALLKRDMSAVSGEAARSPLNAFRAIRNKVSRSGSTMTVCKEDDVTTGWTAALTTDAAAVAITVVDPA